ncbi:L-threonine 3-dehydrogenase [Planctomycetes bacterium Poly30]|uniref:L-threonine 3-dehydrogenase n=1 Tax=Saltatorellus ferox TaxID=2528018 RepID=A0A518EZB7_9BACT|nr:L-threonine 3-dehydrogenase [Planctomycetes bacterium Poly30]
MKTTSSPKSLPARAGTSMDALALGPLPLEARVTLARRDVPGITWPDGVVVEILAAGLCRTDLYVADGTLAATPGVVLGHEAAGLVRAVGPAVTRLNPGVLVGLDPRVPCGECSGCSGDPASVPALAAPNDCLNPRRLGVELDGVFADFVAVPAACAYPIAAEVDALRAAYLEPVAAAMGALDAGLRPTDRGVIVGEGRIAELTARVLEHAGFSRPQILAPKALASRVPAGGLDFVIDAGLPDDGALAAMTAALRKRGTLVLKSRTARPRSFAPADWVAREITVVARAYGSFERAAEALADPALVLEDLFGSARPLAEYREVFAEGRRSEAVKLFFVPTRTLGGIG